LKEQFEKILVMALFSPAHRLGAVFLNRVVAPPKDVNKFLGVCKPLRALQHLKFDH